MNWRIELSGYGTETTTNMQKLENIFLSWIFSSRIADEYDEPPFFITYLRIIIIIAASRSRS